MLIVVCDGPGVIEVQLRSVWLKWEKDRYKTVTKRREELLIQGRQRRKGNKEERINCRNRRKLRNMD